MKVQLISKETLDQENTPDPLEGEQTWPTEEEMKEAEGLLLDEIKLNFDQKEWRR